MAKKEVKKAKEVTKDEEDFLDEKKDKKEKKSLFNRIMNVILWIVLFIWMGICLFDFYKVHQTEDPVFCLKRETIDYKDGKVKSCLGLGYKIYQYNRKCFKRRKC